MMKKISKILLVFILLFALGVAKVYAATPTFRLVTISMRGLKNSNLITYDWYNGTAANSHKACASPTVCKNIYETWNLYSVQIDNKYYILYCLNLGKSTDKDGPMTQYNNLDNVTYNDTSLSQAEKDKRTNLLKTLLLYGYNADPYNNTSLDTLIANDPKTQTKLIAMQILVWEIVEGGRTTFDTPEPQYNGEYSLYNQVIFKNGGSDPSKTDTLYYYYHKFRDDARLREQATPAPAFDKSNYVLTYDSSKKVYKNTISGLGEYKSCISDNKDVKVDVSQNTSTATVSSSKTINKATITCRYFRGNGASNLTTDEEFRHFKFNKAPTQLQDMIYGVGLKVYSKSFTVSTDSINIEIKKVDEENKTISSSPSKFTLTHVNNQSYSKAITGNGSAVNLIYSGQYKVSEETPPKGYESIKDFNITINGETSKVTSCSNQEVVNGNLTCLNRQVIVKYNGTTIQLVITDVAKNFKILKVDANNNAINGATFVIKDSKGNVVKFSKSNNNIYKYDANGTITELNNNSLSSYPVSLLPEGEYKIIETNVPYPYRLATSEEDRTTNIKIDSNRNLLIYNKKLKTYEAAGADATVRIINYRTKFTVHKIGHSNPLEGVQFELYNSDRSVRLNSLYESPGVYNYVDDQNSVDNYVYVTNSSGNITINNLPAGKYWLKEIYTIPPYVLPTGEGVYTEVDINIDEDGVSINNSYVNSVIEISNTPNSFNFYKRDTEGNALTTGKYKLQKFDKEANKYVDLKLVEVPNDGTYNEDTVIYKVDNKDGKIQFTLTKGVATFIDMESSSTYRIIETVAPDGYTKASIKDTATVRIDEYGNASGLLVLIDQKIVKEDDSAYAELIVNIQTGKQRILYAAVILVVIGIIAGLIAYNRKK